MLAQGKHMSLSLWPSVAHVDGFHPFCTSSTAGGMPLATSSTRPFPDLGTFTEHLDGKSKALVGGRVACKVSVAHFS